MRKEAARGDKWWVRSVRRKPGPLWSRQWAIHHDTARLAWERFGIIITPQELRAMVGTIQRQECEFIERETCRRKAWRMIWRGRRLRVVYSNSAKAILSVEPEDAPAQSERGEAA